MADNLVRFERKPASSGRASYVDLVRRAGLALAEHAEDYVPDALYADDEQVLTLTVSQLEPAKVSVNLDLYLRA